MRKKLFCGILAISSVLCLATLLPATTISEKARQHFDRGMAAIEIAKTPEDYVLAIEEFQKVQAIAPGWPDIYYNLGLIQEKTGKYKNAAISLRQYLQLVPDSPDAAAMSTQKDMCPDVSEYSLEIISKRQVKMSRRRILPQIQKIAAQIHNLSYVFVKK